MVVEAGVLTTICNYVSVHGPHEMHPSSPIQDNGHRTGRYRHPPPGEAVQRAETHEVVAWGFVKV